MTKIQFRDKNNELFDQTLSARTSSIILKGYIKAGFVCLIKAGFVCLLKARFVSLLTTGFVCVSKTTNMALVLPLTCSIRANMNTSIDFIFDSTWIFYFTFSVNKSSSHQLIKSSHKIIKSSSHQVIKINSDPTSL